MRAWAKRKGEALGLGWYISLGAHAALILALILGGLFVRERQPLPVSDVSLISAEDFAALTAPGAGPEVETQAPEPETPAEDAAPEAPAEDVAPEVSEPDTVAEPAPAEEPVVEQPPLIPDAIVEDQAPVIDTPETNIDGSAPVSEGVPEPAPRVAPTPQVAPPPEAERAPEVIPDRAPEPSPDPVEETPPEEDPAAPEQAADRVVTEAEEDAPLAPASAMRPRTRPQRPTEVAETPAPEPAPEPQPEPQPSTDDAVRAALGQTDAPTGPVGPPLTGGEKDAFRVAVGDCWVVDSGGRSSGVTVVVGFDLSRDGTVVGDVELIASSGGTNEAVNSAFERARRAVLRCQRGGYDLPADKYEHWREVEITFNPEGMQFK